jgi:ATP-dependent Clp protease ATP-binding subunit ClpA
MIGKRTEEILNRAVQSAIARRHEYFTVEHVFLCLLDEEDVKRALEACGADPQKLSELIEAHLEKDVPKSGDGGPSDQPPVATLSVQRLVQRALFHVQSAGKDEILPVDLLVAIYQAQDSRSLFLLEEAGVTRLELVRYLSHGDPESEKENESPSSAESSKNDSGEGEGTSEGAKGNALKEYCQNLNEMARAGKIDPLVGRDQELDRMIQTLVRRRKNNPLLVGEAGVGKTALAEGLALRITRGDVPPILLNAVVYALDLGSLLAGSKFRGDFEQRLKRVLRSLAREKEKGKEPILLIDEIHTIIGAGSVSGGTLDAANLLKPSLSRGDLRCIGATTYAEYRSHFEKDSALARRFQKIDVTEPSQDEAIRILEGLKEGFEKHHGVRYTAGSLRSAVELSAKHLTDRFLPDKAIDVIDEVGARMRLKRSRDAAVTETPTVDVPEIEEAIATIARIPPRSVNHSQKERLRNLERDLKLAIFGQDAAIETIVSAIRLARSGLRTGERPVGSFLFCGPTGVGKTELAKQLVNSLGVSFQRFDMSEYGEKHTVSRLIGAPPGYVGFEQAGLLTEAAIKHPHSVILLDEIEKAHPDVWNILLQVMDHGFLTDNNGKKADFRNVVLLMTSNVGSREMERRPVGFMAGVDQPSSRSQKAVEQTFTPEFRNRLDGIVYFNALGPLTIAQVVGKQLVELETQLLARGVELTVAPEVREWLAQKGYDPRLGARPMRRLIQDRLKKPLAEHLLFGELEHGGTVTIRLVNGEPDFEIHASAGETVSS